MDDETLPTPTERLRFGLWHDDDDAMAQAIWGDPDVTRFTGGPFTPGQVMERLAREVGNGRRHGIQYWPLFLRADDRLIGCCGLRPREGEQGVAEFGFQFRPDAWGRGYATEAATTAIGWACRRRFTALVAGHHPENGASKRVLHKLGFRYTHDELYPPTQQLEPCYRLPLQSDERVDGAFTPSRAASS